MLRKGELSVKIYLFWFTISFSLLFVVIFPEMADSIIGKFYDGKKKYLAFIEKITEVPIKFVSVGPDRSQTLMVD